MAEEPQYTEDNIRSLDWKEHIRMRPGMYIGKLGDGAAYDDGIYVLLKEVLDNCIDEYVMGHGKTIEVSIHGGKVKVRDYGRGIPLGKVIDCVSKINTGGKYDSRAFKKSVGLNGVGTKAVNALSSHFSVESMRDGKMKRAEFELGNLTGDLPIETTSRRKGTKVIFEPDTEIFVNYKYRMQHVERLIWNYVYLNTGLTIMFNGQKYFSENGLKDLLEANLSNEPIYPIIHLRGEDIEVALTHSNAYGEEYYSFVNGQYTTQGGTHQSAFREAYVKVIREFYGKDYDVLDVRAGVVAAVSVKVMEPVFESQTKTKLGSNDVGPDGPSMRAFVLDFLKKELDNFLHRNTEVASALQKKILQSERERKDLAGIKKLARDRAKKANLHNKKLRDCRSHLNKGGDEAEKSTLFITEGDSASGSITKARSVISQAVFSLKGKPLNSFGLTKKVVYENEEFNLLQAALNIEEGLDGLRYNNVVIATDADVDGMHIRLLLITFFLQFFPELIKNGHLYVLQTPLFRVRDKKETVYCYSETEKQEAQGRLKGKIEITRFKGLGEISPDEFKHFIGEDIRLDPVVITSDSNLKEMMRFYMGKNTPERQEFIIDNLKVEKDIIEEAVLNRLTNKSFEIRMIEENEDNLNQESPEENESSQNDEHLEDGEELESDDGDEQGNEGEDLQDVIKISGMYNEWFLDYASYVILERAVPHLHDGLKPVQRRILHSLNEMDDGRYHKVANVIGNTMKFHPHGDASIGDALVQIGQKDLLFDCQGNWGNTATGDRAAAPRYIEVRLNKFALHVAYNAKTTNWLASYDGRAKEPETLPVKFPLLLAQGGEGIAVGLACKMLPHNFVELIDASIQVLRGKSPKIYPDFPSGGMADVTNYNDGLRGGKVKVRAKIKKESNKLLLITEMPAFTTTSSLIDSILKANDKGKIKIKKIEDNTAEHVEVAIYLANGVSPDKTIDALYAFTDCETSISPNACVIESDKPRFVGVSEMLKISTNRTKDLLEKELQIKLGELQETWHFSSLEKIFIENRIYRDIEECETWEAILKAIHKGLKPHIKHLLRKVTDEDVTRLTEIRIKRISKFDSFKADEKIAGLEKEIAQVKHDLEHLTDFAIEYFKEIKSKFGAGRERKTELKTFDRIDASKVAVTNAKLYVNKEEGFVGTGLKRSEGEFVCDCSDIDDVIIFRNNGKMLVTRASSKAFVGKGIMHVQIWKKGDSRTVYNAIYQDGKNGRAMMKRFSVTSITRDKEYDITKGSSGSKVLYFTANPNGEAEKITLLLKPVQRIKKLKIDIDFADLGIKGRSAGGNVASKFPVRKVELREAGKSTLGARKIWFDETVQRLNSDERGTFLGAFNAEDKILVLNSDGSYKLSGFGLSTHFDEDKIHLEKWEPMKVISAVYYDGEKEAWYAKRFFAENSSKRVPFITESENSRLAFATTLFKPIARMRYNKKFKKTRDKEDELIDVEAFIAIKGLKALGNKMNSLPVTEIYLEPANVDIEAEELAKWIDDNELDIPDDSNDQSGEEAVSQNPNDIEMEVVQPNPEEIENPEPSKPVGKPNGEVVVKEVYLEEIVKNQTI